jgi:hypothetical protein
LRSFTKEPSLNLVYFLIPASLAFLLEGRRFLILGSACMVFGFLSFSGSVFMSVIFAILWWIVLRLFSVRSVLLYGMPLVLFTYLAVITRIGLDPLLDVIEFIQQYGTVFAKTSSLAARSSGAIATMDAALGSPFGSRVLAEVTGPWLLNAALEAGWIGVALLLLFLGKLASRLELMKLNRGAIDRSKLACFMLLGSITTVVVFNDYQMSNYAGIALLAFLYRIIELRGADA